MAYLAVDKGGEECIYQTKPVRNVEDWGGWIYGYYTPSRLNRQTHRQRADVER